MEIIGTIKEIGEVEQIKDTFKKRNVVITDNTTQYPQHLQCELTQDKCSLLDNFKVGQDVKAQINLRGREWTDKEGKVKYFNSIQIWKLESMGTTTATTEDKPKVDDLPF
jgi:translation initiation factor IF-3